MKTTPDQFHSEVEPVRRQLEHWRRTRRQAKERIPEWLWSQISRLARSYGVSRASRSLGVQIVVPGLLRRDQLLHLHRHLQPPLPSGQTRQKQARPLQSAPDQLCAVLHDRRTPAAFLRSYEGNRNDSKEFPLVLEIFHEMKDRRIGAWWPLHHWTDSKIQVHGLYCTIAVLLRALLWRRAHQAGLRLSMAALLEKLGRIRQVINVFPVKRAGQSSAHQEVLTKRDEMQERLIEILGLQPPKSAV